MIEGIKGILDDISSFINSFKFNNKTPSQENLGFFKQSPSRKRINSPLYKLFIFSWIAVNWNLVYVFFFTSEQHIFEVTGLLKDQYLYSLMPNTLLLNLFPVVWIWKSILLPIALAFFFMWILPLVAREFYRQDILNQRELGAIKSAEEKKQETAELEEEKNQEVIRNDIEPAWDEDYNLTRESSKTFLKDIAAIVDTVYGRGGDTVKVTSDSDGKKNIKVILENRIVAFADSLGLINISDIGLETEKITLTQKGKYFIKKFWEEKSSLKLYQDLQ